MSSADNSPQPTQSNTGITGTWYNKLGSRMEVTTNADGSLVGTYHSGVSVPDVFVLARRYDTAVPDGLGVSLGWTVTYSTDTVHSTATWSGQYFASKPEPKPQPEQIVTQWLLTRSTGCEKVWESTHLGHDEFTRTPPPLPTDTANFPPTYASNFPPTYNANA